MSAVDSLADKAEAASERLAGSNGLKRRLAAELAEDAVFLRKLKPGLIKKRARGETPPAPSAPQLGEPKAGEQPKPKGTGPNPFLVVGVALLGGIALAKLVDWRSHAHPRW
jgi:hypothetical protein